MIGEGYRFGFNGHEKDDEIAGAGNHIDFGARGYDSRLGRWKSPDPKRHLQPGWSSYKGFLCNPVLYTDPDGEIEYITIETFYEATGETKITKVEAPFVMTDGKMASVHDKPWFGPVNYYYNFETHIKTVVHADGTFESTTEYTLLTEQGPNDWEPVVLWGDPYGMRKSDWDSKQFDPYLTPPGEGIDGTPTESPDNPYGIDGNTPPDYADPLDFDFFTKDYQEFEHGDTVENDGYHYRTDEWYENHLIIDTSGGGTYQVVDSVPEGGEYEEVNTSTLPH